MKYSFKRKEYTNEFEKFIRQVFKTSENNKPKLKTKVFKSSKSKSKDLKPKDVTLYIERGQAKKSAGWMPWH